jgi:hypothetical protein
MAQKNENPPTSLDKLRQDLEARQRNLLWPDTLINARSVDEFLWKGSPHPNGIQRAGMALFGMFYVGIGAVAFLLIDSIYLRILLGAPWAAFGAKILHNAFRRKRPGP